MWDADTIGLVVFVCLVAPLVLFSLVHVAQTKNAIYLLALVALSPLLLVVFIWWAIEEIWESRRAR